MILSLLRCPQFRTFLSFALNAGYADHENRDSAAAIRDSHQQMLDLLQEVNRDAQESHPFLGVRQLRLAKQNLEEVPHKLSPHDLSARHGIYGQELLRMGQAEDAVREMEQALQLLDEHPQQVTIEHLQQVVYQVAIANLRLGENVNCVHCVNGERCLFPVQGRGIHEAPEGSQRARDLLVRALEMNPQDLRARWLLNIACMTLGEYPDQVPSQWLIPPERFQGAQSPVGEFQNVARNLGLGVLGCAGGVIVDDFDGDLDFDIVFSTWATDGQLIYFRNNADGTFTNATAAAGLTGILGGLNLLQADYDNDGDLDILVLRGAWLQEHGRHPKSLLQNDGGGVFVDVTFAAGLATHHFPSQTAAWTDFDLDGDLDLFVGNESFVSQLFDNDGKGHFRDVAIEARANVLGFTKGCVAGDYNGDGYPDLYISNLLGPNVLLKNNGDRTFTNVARQENVTAPYDSFSVWFWDYNNDGNLDLYAGSYNWGIQHVAADYLGMPAETEPDCFYRGTVDGHLENATRELGFTRVTQPMGVNIGDIDNDGFLDFYLGTGYVDYEGLIPNLLFHNVRGERFDDVTFSARVGHLQKGHGVALADLDQDGHQDIIAVMGGWFAGDAFARAVFRNPGSGNHGVSVRLKGKASNSFGIGARLKATFTSQGIEQSIYRWVSSGGSFGANPLRTHLGMGQADRLTRLEVYWPRSGTTQVFTDISAGQYVEIEENSPKLSARVLPSIELRLPANE